MIDKLKFPLISVFSLLVFAWIGSGIFRYFTHSTPPVVFLKGLEDNGSYAGNLTFSAIANNDYKVLNLQILLDDKEFINKRVKAKQFDIPLSIDTTTMTQGAHTLDVIATDASYSRNNFSKKIIFNVDNAPLHAAVLSPEYSVYQGKTLQLKIQSNKKLDHASVNFLSKNYSFYPESENSTLYECFIPIDCEERVGESLVSIDVQDLVKNSLTLNTRVQVKPFEFKKQRGFSVSEEKLSQEKEASMSAKMLHEALEKWVPESPKKKLWSGKFETPVEVQKMTTPFGEIRMTPERGRYMHKGVDLINRPKCVVWAAQDGRIIIKDRFFLTGNTVVVDHGLGIFTLYAHLEDYADIEVGSMVKKGNALGKLGMTGYATGYHLHWELRINNVAVDPLEWTERVF